MDQELALADADDDRRSRILSAAERAFARHGFHGASMQHVASEARMSAGNLYRYFDSKDAIVSGLTERDQAALARDFRQLACSNEILPALDLMLRKHLIDVSVERNQLILEIWAEAARNSAIAAMCGGIDREVSACLSALIESAQQDGSGPNGVDPGFVARVMTTVVAGLFKRRATEPSFDGEVEVALALGIFQAAFSGALRPYAKAGEAARS